LKGFFKNPEAISRAISSPLLRTLKDPEGLLKGLKRSIKGSLK
jgi:hypothetical protein